VKCNEHCSFVPRDAQTQKILHEEIYQAELRKVIADPNEQTAITTRTWHNEFLCYRSCNLLKIQDWISVKEYHF